MKVELPDASKRQHSSVATHPEHMAERKLLDLKRWYVLSLSVSYTYIILYIYTHNAYKILFPPFYIRNIMYHMQMCTNVYSVVDHCSCIIILYYYAYNNDITLEIA